MTLRADTFKTESFKNVQLLIYFTFTLLSNIIFLSSFIIKNSFSKVIVLRHLKYKFNETISVKWNWLLKNGFICLKHKFISWEWMAFVKHKLSYTKITDKYIRWNDRMVLLIQVTLNANNWSIYSLLWLGSILKCLLLTQVTQWNQDFLVTYQPRLLAPLQ